MMAQSGVPLLALLLLLQLALAASQQRAAKSVSVATFARPNTLPESKEGITLDEYFKMRLDSLDNGQVHQRHRLLTPADILDDFRNWNDNKYSPKNITSQTKKEDEKIYGSVKDASSTTSNPVRYEPLPYLLMTTAPTTPKQPLSNAIYSSSLDAIQMDKKLDMLNSQSRIQRRMFSSEPFVLGSETDQWEHVSFQSSSQREHSQPPSVDLVPNTADSFEGGGGGLDPRLMRRPNYTPSTKFRSRNPKGTSHQIETFEIFDLSSQDQKSRRNQNNNDGSRTQQPNQRTNMHYEDSPPIFTSNENSERVYSLESGPQEMQHNEKQKRLNSVQPVLNWNERQGTFEYDTDQYSQRDHTPEDYHESLAMNHRFEPDKIEHSSSQKFSPRDPNKSVFDSSEIVLYDHDNEKESFHSEYFNIQEKPKNDKPLVVGTYHTEYDRPSTHYITDGQVRDNIQENYLPRHKYSEKVLHSNFNSHQVNDPGVQWQFTTEASRQMDNRSKEIFIGDDDQYTVHFENDDVNFAKHNSDYHLANNENNMFSDVNENKKKQGIFYFPDNKYKTFVDGNSPEIKDKRISNHSFANYDNGQIIISSTEKDRNLYHYYRSNEKMNDNNNHADNSNQFESPRATDIFFENNHDHEIMKSEQNPPSQHHSYLTNENNRRHKNNNLKRAPNTAKQRERTRTSEIFTENDSDFKIKKSQPDPFLHLFDEAPARDKQQNKRESGEPKKSHEYSNHYAVDHFPISHNNRENREDLLPTHEKKRGPETRYESFEAEKSPRKENRESARNKSVSRTAPDNTKLTASSRFTPEKNVAKKDVTNDRRNLDGLSVHNMAGPPYHDPIPDDVVKTLSKKDSNEIVLRTTNPKQRKDPYEREIDDFLDDLSGGQISTTTDSSPLIYYKHNVYKSNNRPQKSREDIQEGRDIFDDVLNIKSHANRDSAKDTKSENLRVTNGYKPTLRHPLDEKSYETSVPDDETTTYIRINAQHSLEEDQNKPYPERHENRHHVGHHQPHLNNYKFNERFYKNDWVPQVSNDPRPKRHQTPRTQRPTAQLPPPILNSNFRDFTRTGPPPLRPRTPSIDHQAEIRSRPDFRDAMHMRDHGSVTHVANYRPTLPSSSSPHWPHGSPRRLRPVLPAPTPADGGSSDWHFGDMLKLRRPSDMRKGVREAIFG